MKYLIPLIALTATGCYQAAAERYLHSEDFEHVHLEATGIGAWDFRAVRYGKACKGEVTAFRGKATFESLCGGSYLPYCHPSDPESCERLAVRLYETNRQDSIQAAIDACRYGGKCGVLGPKDLGEQLYYDLGVMGCDRRDRRDADACAMIQPTSPFDNAIVRLGTIEFDVNLGPLGADDCRHRIFVAFDETFPDGRLENVAVIINNCSLPTAVPDATVAMHEGQQGFWLRVTNTLRATDERDASQAAVSGKLVLSWIAVLGNAEPHELSNGRDFEVCTGKLPPQPVVRYSMVEWPTDYTDLFGEHFQQCDLPLVFFTSTHGGNAAVNCVARVSRGGIENLTGYNTESQATNKASLYWAAIAKRNTPGESLGAGARNLWINCGASHLVRHHSRTATAGDWSSYHRPFKPFFTEPPHTIMTGSGLNVEGHHACIVGLAFHQELKSGNMKGRSCDVEPGQSGVSWIAFGPVAT